MFQGDTEATESGFLVVTFFIGDALLGIDANSVQEVIQINKLTLLHGAPSYIKGVMNLRGRVVTIINLAEKLDLESVLSGSDNRILIVEWKQEYVGLLVEKVAEVIQVELEKVKQPPGNVHGVQIDYISGVFPNAHGNIAGILDVNKMLEIKEKNDIGEIDTATMEFKER